MKDIDEEYETFEDSMLYMSGSEERDARLEFSKKLLGLIEQCPDSASLYHKLGLCLYGIDSWQIDDQKSIEISFLRALLLDEHSIFSRIFLTHFYFDVGEFNLSLKMNNSIGPYLQDDEVPVWRLVKLHQIKLSCMIYLEILTQDELEQELGRVISRYGELDEGDAIAAEPSELRASIIGGSGIYDLGKIKAHINKIKELCELANQ